MRGERFSRWLGPIVQWENEGEWVRGARSDRPRIAEIIFKGRMTCLSRVGGGVVVPEYEMDTRGGTSSSGR